jgi:hypothetical protein
MHTIFQSGTLKVGGNGRYLNRSEGTLKKEDKGTECRL